jgi:hypothetical protein
LCPMNLFLKFYHPAPWILLRWIRDARFQRLEMRIRLHTELAHEPPSHVRQVLVWPHFPCHTFHCCTSPAVWSTSAPLTCCCPTVSWGDKPRQEIFHPKSSGAGTRRYSAQETMSEATTPGPCSTRNFTPGHTAQRAGSLRCSLSR